MVTVRKPARADVKRGRKAVSPTELRARARSVRLVISDVDGVLTDGGVYYSERGEELKRFNVRDGMGVERLRNVGIATAFLTRELSPSVAARAQKLRLSRVYLGVEDKRAHLEVILQECRLSMGQIAFIGDDVNDLEIIQAIGVAGLTGAPADATPAVKAAAMHRCDAKGGHGAFRDFAEWILTLRGKP